MDVDLNRIHDQLEAFGGEEWAEKVLARVAPYLRWTHDLSNRWLVLSGTSILRDRVVLALINTGFWEAAGKLAETYYLSGLPGAMLVMRYSKSSSILDRPQEAIDAPTGKLGFANATAAMLALLEAKR